MAAYVGMQEQITKNNRNSVLLLISFPLLILGTIYGVLFFLSMSETGVADTEMVNDAFLKVAPFVVGGVAVWFLIAWKFNNAMINMATGAKPLERKENMRVYNLVENLCMSVGMKMPKVNIIESPALNAFASGINEKTYTVTLTRGIIDTLDDDELEGVIAHELMHIRNKDVRLLIISIIFVGILSFVVSVAFRSLLYGNMGRKRDNKDNRLMLIILLVSAIAYLLSIVFKFALSRKREYLADTGAAQMTRNPQALANALRKISGNHNVDSVKSDDVKGMFIENGPDKDSSAGLSGGIGSIFSTHPPIEKRIKILEQF